MFFIFSIFSKFTDYNYLLTLISASKWGSLCFITGILIKIFNRLVRYDLISTLKKHEKIGTNV
jgi:hypothetical protein